MVVRVRPPRADGGRLCVSSEGEATVLTHDSGPDRAGKALRFNFSRAFFWDQEASSRALFETTGRQLLEQALAGYHVSLLAYGQTGEGRRGAALPARHQRWAPRPSVDLIAQALARRTRCSALPQRRAWCQCCPRSCFGAWRLLLT